MWKRGFVHSEVDILYLHLCMLWLPFVFNLVIIINLMLWKLKIFDFTASNSCVATSLSSSSWYVSSNALHLLFSFSTCLLRPLYTQSKWFSFLKLEQHLPYPWHLHGSCVLPQHLYLTWTSLLLWFIKWIVLLLLFFHGINSLFFFMTSVSTLWAPCASTLLTNANTCLLVTSFVFLLAISSHIISVMIASSFMPLINFSFSLLSSSLCPHSLNFLFYSLANLHYCNDKIVSLCWDINLSLNILNSAIFVVYFSCSLSFRVCMNLNHSQPRQIRPPHFPEHFSY